MNFEKNEGDTVQKNLFWMRKKDKLQIITWRVMDNVNEIHNSL